MYRKAINVSSHFHAFLPQNSLPARCCFFFFSWVLATLAFFAAIGIFFLRSFCLLLRPPVCPMIKWYKQNSNKVTIWWHHSLILIIDWTRQVIKRKRTRCSTLCSILNYLVDESCKIIEQKERNKDSIGEREREREITARQTVVSNTSLNKVISERAAIETAFSCDFLYSARSCSNSSIIN